MKKSVWLRMALQMKWLGSSVNVPVTTCFAFNYHNGDRVSSDNDNYKVNFHLNKTAGMYHCAVHVTTSYGSSCLFFTSLDGLLPRNAYEFY